MPLTPTQREALEQLWAVTASETPAARERDERLLSENGWNVQATVEQIFSMGPGSHDDDNVPGFGSGADRTNTEQRSGPSRLQVDDDVVSPSSYSSLPGRRLSRTGSGSGSTSGSGAGRLPRSPGGTGSGSGAGTAGVGLGLGSGLWGIITWPVSLVMSIVGGVWYFLIRNFVPLSFLPRLPAFLLPPSTPSSSTNLRPRPGPAQDPTTSSLRFIRELELYTRCSTSAGTLPDFYIGPYREFVQSLRTEGKLGLIVLVSGEHEDDEEFKRDVLADLELVRTLKEKEVVVWAADMSSREGYQVSQTLLTTTYPSLTFLSLLPVPNSSTPKLTILSTLSGPPSTSTSVTSIIQSLTTTILPRVTPFLNRLKRERLSLEEARHLRAEQDRAFREAERRDREKLEQQKKKEELERLQKARAERELKEKETYEQNRKIWRRYARKHLLPQTEGSSGRTNTGKSVKIAIRTPFSSERHIRSFNLTPPNNTSTIPLFVYVETLLIPASDSPSTDPDQPPEGFEPKWDFQLVTTYPKKVIEPTDIGGEAYWDVIKNSGGTLFAEKKVGSSWGAGDGGEDSDSDEEIVE
ncbi:hypothetical protein I317_03182 [Kwoniella heveanensis CBS 569]|nr:hypothetical protein I317_03182 [Kwoniella heveanensis CBS 569]